MPASFSRKVRASIADERKASPYYRRMAKQAKTSRDRKTLLRMSRDEARHRRLLKKMKR